MTTMTETEKRIARAAYDAMYPGDPSGRVKVGIADGDIEGFLDDLGESWEWLAFTALRAGLVLIALGSIVFARSLRPYWSLSREKRLHVLDRLYKSDVYVVRQVITMQKATAGFLYGAMIRSEIAPGRAPEVDEALVEWRKLVPKHRAADGHGGVATNEEAA
ncbi:MAG: hypothetical protein JNK05_24215 [Myxococcales bacterium]|nr:hypothetical protein [Myxococcales bacterium]